MITLEQYKEYLVKNYQHEIDNTDNKRLERQKYLDNKYSDDYLNRIILGTSKIINFFLQNKNINYQNIKIEENNPRYITLNLIGGWHSDIIYKDKNGNLISEYILKRFFDNNIIVETKIIEYEFETEDPDILSFDYEYFLYLQSVNTKQFIKLKKK